MRVLVADDDSLVRDLLGDVIEGLGSEVVEAEDGVKAMRILHTDVIDLAILDVNMPGMTGLEVLHGIRGSDDAPLIVILTADPNVEGASQAVRDGAFEYIQKPARLERVVDMFERARRVIALRQENRRYRERLEILVADKTSQLRAKNEELERTCDHLARALESARRSSRLASLGELASGMAHEIRNPLSAISLAAGNLGAEVEGNPEAQECVDDIRRVVDHLSRTVGHILNFARPPKPALQVGDVNEVIQRALKLSGTYARKESITIETELAEDIPPTQLDASQIEQIVVNLLINAVRAIGSGGGRIVVRTWVEGRRICVSLSDSGPGVPENLREQIFAPFYSRFESGTGLGLALCRNLAESHGGDLSVGDAEAELGGARFILVLPMMHASARNPSGAAR